MSGLYSIVATFHTVRPVNLRVLHLQIQPIFSLVVEFMDMEPADKEGQLLYCAFLYKGLKHLWMSVSVGVLEPIPLGIKGQLYVLDCGDGEMIIDSILPEIFETDFISRL